MDEADILGDRIAIMSKGQLQCCGSSLFLKKTYGVGYQLVVEKQTSRKKNQPSQHGSSENGDDENLHSNDDLLKKIVTDNVDDATLLSNVGTEMSFQLPMASSSQFTPMFEGLDKQIEKGTVTSYGVSITTLEGKQCLSQRLSRKMSCTTNANYVSQRFSCWLHEATLQRGKNLLLYPVECLGRPYQRRMRKDLPVREWISKRKVFWEGTLGLCLKSAPPSSDVTRKRGAVLPFSLVFLCYGASLFLKSRPI